VWVWISVVAMISDGDVEAEAAAQKPRVVAETATIARERIVFFIFLYPDSCRAQPLSLLFALYENFSLKVTLHDQFSYKKFIYLRRPDT